MTEILLGALLAALLGWAVYAAVRRARRGGGCCGEREAAEKRVRSRGKGRYPHEITLKIGGMTCENCARKVENALNALDGVWASVDISSHTARVRTRSIPDRQRLRQAVSGAGYVVMEETQKPSESKTTG